MSNLQFNAKAEMASTDLNQLQSDAATAKANIAGADTVDDIKTAICTFWSKYGKYFRDATVLPIIGKPLSILCDLLDSICK